MSNSTGNSNNNNENKYWLSLDQWRNDPGFKEMVDKEFQSSPLSEESQGGWARRDFLKLMGASLALGSFGCVRRPIQKIVPYVNRPRDIVPGVSNFYASTFQNGGEVTGLVVRTREGRPIKMEGNEFFPEVGEALNIQGQAHILSLYDPDRLTKPVENLLNTERTNKDTVSTDWAKADKFLSSKFSQGGAYVLSDSNPSKTSREIIKSFATKFGGEYVEWSPNSYEAFKKSFSVLGASGESLPRLRIDNADYIFSLGTDFLETSYGALANSKAWGRRRDPETGEPVKLVQAESLMSLTGTNSDRRVILSSNQYLAFISQIAIKVASSLGVSTNLTSDKSALVNKASRQEDDALLKEASKIASELIKHKEKSLVLAYGSQVKNEDYEEIQKVAHFLNSILGADGSTLDYSQSPYVSYRGSDEGLEKLIGLMNKGVVKSLVIHDLNIVYLYPQREKLLKALKKVKTVVYTGSHNDETGSVSHYILPDDHSLEKWNEYESLKGIYTVQQPTISPLYDTRSFEAGLLKWIGSEKTWFDSLSETWKSRYNANKSASGFSTFEEFWVALLQKGVWDLSGFRNSKKSARPFSGSFKSTRSKKTKEGHFELSLYEKPAIGSGKYANVSWLQELPDPVSKVVWDNYLTISPSTAEKMHLNTGDVVLVKGESFKEELPVYIQPGQDSHTVGAALGYGRKGAGKVADGVGKSVTSFAKGFVSSGLDVSFSKTGKKIEIANTQGHHTMDGRQIVTETSYNEYKKDESSGIHKHKVFSLWSKHKYTGHKWAMSVDLSKCTGCSACVVACQSENNIPVVGKKHILNGREMHWIRIDRYYSGSPESPRTVHQPVMCQHCDNAPCETVCPVLATVHSSEGTNDMVYNRCVGTRYCSNNCPYKVRRFNWFNYSKVQSPLNMALNPEVTVRSRGVMEKCTFCIHKIQDGKAKAKMEKRDLKDGDIRPACEITCGSDAIVFGDMNDSSSKVSKKFAEGRTYQLLEEINVVPSVRYMTRVLNTEEKLAGHHGSAGHGEEKGHGKSGDDDHGHKKDSHAKETHHEGGAH